MMKQILPSRTIAAILCLLISPILQAVEVRGTLVAAGTQLGPPNSQVIVKCTNSNDLPSAISNTGSYSVRGIETNSNCTMQIMVSGMLSDPIYINTADPVVRFNGEIRVIGGRVIVLQQQ